MSNTSDRVPDDGDDLAREVGSKLGELVREQVREDRGRDGDTDNSADEADEPERIRRREAEERSVGLLRERERVREEKKSHHEPHGTADQAWLRAELDLGGDHGAGKVEAGGKEDRDQHERATAREGGAYFCRKKATPIPMKTSNPSTRLNWVSELAE